MDVLELSLGYRLLLPHVTSVLEYIKTKVSKKTPSGKQKKRLTKINLASTELVILSKSVTCFCLSFPFLAFNWLFFYIYRLSEHVSDTHQCSTVTSLLLPYLKCRKTQRNQQTEVHLLNSVANLLQKVQEKDQFIV